MNLWEVSPILLKNQLKIEREKTKRATLRLSEPKKIRPFHNC